MHESWTLKGGYAHWRLAEPEMRNAWLLPATHLKMEENPDHAARRISYEWAGLKGEPRFVMVQSHVRRRESGNHWDLCFVYEMQVRGLPKCKPWWSEMRFVRSEEIRNMKVGRGHKDILREAGYL
jgi:ADP-ribose pyrophosphatase YjhB (NUDIX family)